MKQTRKILVALLVLMTLLVSLAVVALPASAAGEDTEIAFKLGNDGSATHTDGSSAATTYTETVNGYKLSITNGTKMYPSSRDAKGNGCIKLGTSSVVGGFKFTVPDDVDSVIIAAAKYKANTSKLQVNGTTYTLTKASNNGEYDLITVDTSVTKTVSVTTVSGGVRAMINSITFVIPFEGDADCEHTNTISNYVEPTCTEAGYYEVECADCGADMGVTPGEAALGHTDANGDFKCEVCNSIAAPAADEALTTAQADALGKLHAHNTFTDNKYYVTGIITRIVNTTYGNFYIKDASGKEFYVYGLYSSNGSTRYDAMTTKPGVGDEVTVYGIIGAYNSAAQMKNAWLDELIVHDHDYSTVKQVVAPTATAEGYTIYSCSAGCGKTEIRDYVDPAITGSGTEADPFLIGTVENFIKFRDSVNAGETTYNAPGVWVALAADIDLAGSVWTKAIGDGHEWSFDGNFDGKNFAVKNLTVNPYADSGEYVCGGLFGYVYGNVTIKNLVLENVNVSTEDAGFNVGALVGFVYGTNVVIDNVTVKGDVIIDAPNVYGVGAIVGYAFYTKVSISNTQVVANEGSVINGYSFVGGITGYSANNATFDNCSVSGVAITGTHYSVGGVAGIILDGNSFNNCSVDATLAGLANVGYIVGAISGNGYAININNCTASGKLVGGNYGDNLPVVASCGNKYYTGLGDAIAAANNGDTVVLCDDIAIDSETFTIADGASLTIDLNGHKIVVTDNKTSNYELFYIYGELTVKGGTIELTSTNNRAWGAMSAIFHNRGGVLNIENGTYANLGGTDMAWVVDNSGNYYGDATTNIYDGTLTSTYTAIRNRMEQNSHGASGTAILNVYGGTINGTTSAIWAQAASTSTTAPATGVITINGGNIGIINTARSEGAESMTVINGGTVESFKGEIGELVVNGGTITGTVSMFTASGDVVDFVVDENGAYITFQDLINAGGEIVLTKDIVLYAPIVINGDVSINLNGHTITYTSDVLGESMITNKGNLVIIDSAILTRSAGEGKIVYNYIGEADSSYGKGNYAITNTGSLTLNAVIEVDVPDYEGKFPHALYVIHNAGSITINGGEISNEHNVAIRQWNDGSITINGGEIVGTRAIWVHLPSSNSAIAPVIDITINNGTLTALGGESNGSTLAIYSYSYGSDMGNVSLTVNGGDISGDIALTAGSNKNNVETVVINGGSITDLYSYGDDATAIEAITINGGDFLNSGAAIYAEDDGVSFVANANGEFTVIEASTAIPSIGDNGNWFIGDVDTGVKAEAVDGVDGETPYIGENGNWWIGETDTGVKAEAVDGVDGETPYIGANGNWWIGETDTGVKAEAVDGKTPYVGANGNWWIGETDTGYKAAGTDGVDGKSPYVGENGNWWVGETDTGVKAAGTPGVDGKSPYVGANGNWWIGEDDLGVKATADEITIGEDGFWYINGVKQNVKAEAIDGHTPVITIGEDGYWYIDGVKQDVKAKGANGHTPVITIGEDGYWYVDGESTGVKAIGVDGHTPEIVIGENGNWFIDGVDTGVKAEGIDGEDGTNGADGYTPEITIGEDGFWYIDGVQTKIKAVGQDGNSNNEFITICVAVATGAIIFALAVLLFWRVRRRSWWCVR